MSKHGVDLSALKSSVKTHFDLELPVTLVELKAKHRELVKKFHPDVYKGGDEKFKTINNLYEVVKSFEKHPFVIRNDDDISDSDTVSENAFTSKSSFYRNLKECPECKDKGVKFTIQNIPKQRRKTIKPNCSECEDTGYSVTVMVCPKFNASGLEYNKYSQRTVTCSICNGKKTLNKEVPCKKCQGTKKEYTKYRKYECPTCKGIGGIEINNPVLK